MLVCPWLKEFPQHIKFTLNQSFTLMTNIHFSDNCSTTDTISQHISALNRAIY